MALIINNSNEVTTVTSDLITGFGGATQDCSEADLVDLIDDGLQLVREGDLEALKKNLNKSSAYRKCQLSIYQDLLSAALETNQIEIVEWLLDSSELTIVSHTAINCLSGIHDTDVIEKVCDRFERENPKNHAQVFLAALNEANEPSFEFLSFLNLKIKMHIDSIEQQYFPLHKPKNMNGDSNICVHQGIEPFPRS